MCCHCFGHFANRCPNINSDSLIVHVGTNCYPYQEPELCKMFKSESVPIGIQENKIISVPEIRQRVLLVKYSAHNPLKNAFSNISKLIDEGFVDFLYHYKKHRICSSCGH